jgi:trigger factor
MANTVENLSPLERRLTMAVPAADIDRQVDERLKKLARTMRMPGFRPGKVPLKIVAQQYGPQVRSEVIASCSSARRSRCTPRSASGSSAG